MKLSAYDRNWMVGPRGEQPVLCRLVWVPYRGKKGSRYDTMRSWALRNRLFMPGADGYYKHVRFESGVGFFTQPEGMPFSRKTRVSLAELMREVYLFTNGIH